MRRFFVGRIAVTDRVGIGTPVGILTVAVLPGMAPLALAARDVVLDEDQIAFLEALALGELAAGLGDIADILVAHDDGRCAGRVLVKLDVGAADAADLHFHQRRIRRNVRHRVFADFGLARPRPHGCQYLLGHFHVLSFALI